MSRLLLYFHVVWATKRRQPWLTLEKEEAFYRCTLKLIEEAGYETLAINGTVDHVHLLFQTVPQVDMAALMKKVKGVTSALVNDMTGHAEFFRWQEGYYASTVTPSHLPKVRAYVEGQKGHHARGDTHPFWEETGEEAGELEGGVR